MSVFLIAAALLVTTTTALTVVPAAYAERNDDDDDDDHNGDGNRQKVEDESAGLLADCDKNEASNIYICSVITPICRPGAVCTYGDMDPSLVALPISWR